MLAVHPGVCQRWLGNILTFTNREYRYLAYRSFSYWVHGSESKGNRMDPPLCVFNKIVEVCFHLEFFLHGNADFLRKFLKIFKTWKFKISKFIEVST